MTFKARDMQLTYLFAVTFNNDDRHKFLWRPTTIEAKFSTLRISE